MEKEKDMKVKNPSNKERFLTWAHLESNPGKPGIFNSIVSRGLSKI
jgi:hypothetical protein